MTATATIAATERKGVLLVPNTALGFSPRLPAGAPGGGGGAGGSGAAGGSGSVMDKLMPRPPGMGANRKTAKASGSARQIWLLQDGRPVAVPVTLGISNGRLTEVSGEGLREGAAVIVDQQSDAAP